MFKPCVLCDNVTHVSDMKFSSLYGIDGLACQECLVYFKDGGTVHEVNYKTNNEASKGWPWLGGTKGTVKPAVYVAPVPTCSHHLQPFGISATRTVYLSASSDMRTPPQSELPHSAVYFTSTLIYDSVLCNNGAITKDDDETATLFVDWPDMQAVSLHTLVKALRWARQEIEDGKRLEIACIGGHGRTGTFTAALCILYGVGAAEAVKSVREGYCTKAIETAAQIKLLEEFGKALYPDAPVTAIEAVPSKGVKNESGCPDY